MLETFKKIPIRNGRIVFIDGNKQNYFIDNLEYQTQLANVEQPKADDILNVINFYFGFDPLKNLNNVFKYRTYLSTVLTMRNFFEKYQKEKNLALFKEYTDVFAPDYYNLSKTHNVTVLESKRTINFFLNKLIEDCKNDGCILKKQIN